MARKFCRIKKDQELAIKSDPTNMMKSLRAKIVTQLIKEMEIYPSRYNHRTISP